MTLVSKGIPNLTGGISQQAPPLRLINQCQEQINFRASLVNGLQSREPMELNSFVEIDDGAFYPIDRDDDGRYNIVISKNGLNVFDTAGKQQVLSYEGSSLAYLSSAGKIPYQTYKVLTLADHTFILNTEKTVKLQSGVYAGWKNQALVFIKQVSASTTWTLNIDTVSHSVGYGGTNSETGLPHLFVDGTQVASNVNMSTTDIATRLAACFPSYDIKQMGAVLWIRRTDQTAFSIAAVDTRNNTCVNIVTTKVQQFDQLPTIAPDGYIAKVIGSVASNADDYYVMFVTDGTATFGKGVWEECAEPGSNYGLDAATMPHILVHNANGIWSFKAATWDEKLTGDLDSAPNPSFINKKLRNIFLYSNRLCFLTEDLLCMSAAADFENWWNETAVALSDSDPIFISASTEKVADLYDFGVLDDDLIIFGSHGQYRLNAMDVLSPKTAAVTATGKNSYAKGSGIVASGNRLYFGHQNGKHFAVSEYGTSATTGSKEANSITSHVPSLIPYSERVRVTGTENTDTIAVCCDATPDILYIYQYYISGANRLQSAWGKYSFKGCKIHGLFFRENILWLFLTKNSRHCIATIDMAEKITNDYERPVLDFLTSKTSTEETRDWFVDNHLDPTRCAALTTLPSGITTEIPIIAVEGQKITLKKAATAVYIGERIDRRYEFSTPYVVSKSDGTEKVLTTGRWQLQKMQLTCGDSGPFTVTVKPKYDSTLEGYKYLFTGIKVALESSKLGTLPVAEGDNLIPLRGQNTDLEVVISSNSYLPETFISAQWQGNYITKVKSI